MKLFVDWRPVLRGPIPDQETAVHLSEGEHKILPVSCSDGALGEDPESIGLGVGVHDAQRRGAPHRADGKPSSGDQSTAGNRAEDIENAVADAHDMIVSRQSRQRPGVERPPLDGSHCVSDAGEVQVRKEQPMSR